MTTDREAERAEIVAGERINFVECECAIGGCNCRAWSDWFWASVEADPECDGEDRDPEPRTDYPFDIAHCDDVGGCRLRARAVRAGKLIGDHQKGSDHG